MKVLSPHHLICLIIAMSLLHSFSLFAQGFRGNWTGDILFNNKKINITFKINNDSNPPIATMTVLSQGLTDFPADSAKINNSLSTINLFFSQLSIHYQGILTEEKEIQGTFIQSGYKIPLNLHKEVEPEPKQQTPKPPFPYESIELDINTIDNLKLNGTLTLPKGQQTKTVFILVSGSGPQNRDSEMFGHKPFLVIADALSRHGIGVFRYDERGVGQSEGNFFQSPMKLFSSDIESIIKQLQNTKGLEKIKIGLIGHSIGGTLAAQVAARNKSVSFLILMAAPGIDGEQILLQQKAAAERLHGLDEDQIAQAQGFVKGAYEIIVNTTSEGEILQKNLRQYYRNKYGNMISDQQLYSITEQLTQPEILFLLRENPTKFLEKVNCPVLAMNGDKDFQVSASENLRGIKEAIIKNGNKDVETISFKDLNHLFQTCQTGSLEEYATIQESISPRVLNKLVDWLKEQVEKN